MTTCAPPRSRRGLGLLPALLLASLPAASGCMSIEQISHRLDLPAADDEVATWTLNWRRTGKPDHMVKLVPEPGVRTLEVALEDESTPLFLITWSTDPTLSDPAQLFRLRISEDWEGRIDLFTLREPPAPGQDDPDAWDWQAPRTFGPYVHVLLRADGSLASPNRLRDEEPDAESDPGAADEGAASAAEGQE